MGDKISKNHITLDVEVETWFGPADAVKLIQQRLQCPAVKKISFTTVMSDYEFGKDNSENLKLVPQYIYLEKD